MAKSTPKSTVVIEDRRPGPEQKLAAKMAAAAAKAKEDDFVAKATKAKAQPAEKTWKDWPSTFTTFEGKVVSLPAAGPWHSDPAELKALHLAIVGRPAPEDIHIDSVSKRIKAAMAGKLQTGPEEAQPQAKAPSKVLVRVSDLSPSQLALLGADATILKTTAAELAVKLLVNLLETPRAPKAPKTKAPKTK